MGASLRVDRRRCANRRPRDCGDLGLAPRPHLDLCRHDLHGCDARLFGARDQPASQGQVDRRDRGARGEPPRPSALSDRDLVSHLDRAGGVRLYHCDAVQEQPSLDLPDQYSDRRRHDSGLACLPTRRWDVRAVARGLRRPTRSHLLRRRLRPGVPDHHRALDHELGLDPAGLFVHRFGHAGVAPAPTARLLELTPTRHRVGLPHDWTRLVAPARRRTHGQPRARRRSSDDSLPLRDDRLRRDFGLSRFGLVGDDIQASERHDRCPPHWLRRHDGRGLSRVARHACCDSRLRNDGRVDSALLELGRGQRSQQQARRVH